MSNLRTESPEREVFQTGTWQSNMKDCHRLPRDQRERIQNGNRGEVKILRDHSGEKLAREATEFTEAERKRGTGQISGILEIGTSRHVQHDALESSGRFPRSNPNVVLRRQWTALVAGIEHTAWLDEQ